jgi:hypothetical protein
VLGSAFRLIFFATPLSVQLTPAEALVSTHKRGLSETTA